MIYKMKLKKLFTLECFQKQLMDMDSEPFSIRTLLGKMSGNSLTEQIVEELERNIKDQIAILRSMTIEEKKHPEILDDRRLQRIANGSGKQPRDIKLLLKHYEEMKNAMKRLHSKPVNTDPPPTKAAAMPRPKPPIITKAIGRKYGT